MYHGLGIFFFLIKKKSTQYISVKLCTLIILHLKLKFNSIWFLHLSEITRYSLALTRIFFSPPHSLTLMEMIKKKLQTKSVTKCIKVKSAMSLRNSSNRVIPEIRRKNNRDLCWRHRHTSFWNYIKLVFSPEKSGSTEWLDYLCLYFGADCKLLTKALRRGDREEVLYRQTEGPCGARTRCGKQILIGRSFIVQWLCEEG